MSMNIVYIIVALLLGAGGGVALTLALKRRIFAGEYHQLELLKIELEKKSQSELEAQRRQIGNELKEEFANWKNEYNRKQNEKVNKINAMEKRLLQKEENLDKRYINLDNKEKELKKKEKEICIMEEEVTAHNTHLAKLVEEQRLKLEKISGMTVQEAKEMIVKQYESEARLESAQKLKAIEEELREKREALA